MKKILKLVLCISILAYCTSCNKDTVNPETDTDTNNEDTEDTEDTEGEIWKDNFDDGQALNDKYEDVSTNGMSVSTADPFNGTSSLQQTYQTGQVDAGWIIKVIDEGYPDHIFMRWYHKFEPGFESFPPKMGRVRYRNRSEWTSPMGIHCWLNTTAEHGGAVEIDIKASHSTQANSSGWLGVYRTDFTFADPSNIGRWVCFEMEVQLNTPGETDGLYRLWIDNELEAERLDVDFRGSENYKINEAMLDCYWNGGSPKVQNRFFDGFVISTEKIGLDN